LVETLAATPVDVVLVDFDPGTRAHSPWQETFVQSAREAGFRGRFLAFTSELNAKASVSALKAGVSGIFLKSEPPERLLQAIRLVADGAIWLDPKVLQMLADPFEAAELDSEPRSLLTARERKILLGILGGLSNRKIGDSMGLSEGSVKAAVQRMFERTGVRTRSQLVRIALEGSLGNVSFQPRDTETLRFHGEKQLE
jgi:DNA-binding NarL/FixJ family response regulator